MFAFQDSDVSVRRTALETYLLRVYRAHSTHSLEYSEEVSPSSSVYKHRLIVLVCNICVLSANLSVQELVCARC